MTIKPTKVFNRGQVVWQTAWEDGAPELPILAHVDSSGLLVLSQEGRDVVIAPGTVPELCKTLNSLVRGK